ncbi:hypothetical protein AO501_11230 [Mycobacterium gordonae]|uniref:PE domain-containing protein n=1 Tax=Mycobacterium gordonae TaxID=1778 RepID=A0A0Q2LM15_MYCGO|nr:hypothetical protein AO501_11230 [Mycobacterium gordonae]
MSSAAAARISVVGTAAAALAALSEDPIPAISVTAAASASGVAITYDMHNPLVNHGLITAT